MTTPAPAAPSRAERRRAAEAAARDAARRRNRTLGVVVGAVIGVVVLAGLVVWLAQRGDDGTPPPAAAASDTITQPTLLVQLRGEDQLAVANGLLAVGGPAQRGTMVLIPSNLYLDVPTGGSLPLGEVARLPDANASGDALSDLIGVRVDGALVMDPVAFAGLVDAVGGVDADVDVNVVEVAADGSQTVLVAAGPQTLSGQDAALFATYLAPGETEQARLARFQQVFRLAVAKLPVEAAQIDPILTSLGSSARSTVPTSAVGEFLARFRAVVVGDEVDYPSLPVKSIETGGTGDAYSADLEADAALVSRYLPDAARVAGPNSKVRVLVQNGRFVPGLGTSARDRLVDAGYTYVPGGNAPSRLEGPTQIVVPDSTDASLQWGAEIADALGVPATDVRVAAEGQSIADVIVVLGNDFPPEE